MQLIKTTNRCHVSLSMLGESAQTRGLLWQWGLCVIPGCQPVCPRVLFLSNLHLTFRLTALLSHFSWLISFEEIIFELQHRLTVSDDTTDTTHRYEFWQNASHDATATGVCWRRLCLINNNKPRSLSCVLISWKAVPNDFWLSGHVHTQNRCCYIHQKCYKNIHGFNNKNIILKKINKNVRLTLISMSGTEK